MNFSILTTPKIMNPMEITEYNIFFFLLFFFLPLIPLFFLICNKKFSKQSALLPPGPFPWPVVGNMIQVRDYNQPSYAVFAGLARVYGPLMSLKLGSKTAIIASSPAAAREILKTHDKSMCGRYVSPVTPVFNPFTLGFSQDCGEMWRYLRTICKGELFSPKEIEAQVELREKKVAEMLGFLSTKKNKVVDVGSVIYATVTNMLTNALFSVDFLDYEGKGIGEELRDLITRVGELGLLPNISDVFPILGRLDIHGLQKKKMKILGDFVSIWEDIIKERRKQGTSTNSFQRDFLDTLIETGFSDGQIHQLILELLIAGTDTSSMATEWAMADLIKSQEIMQKLKDEFHHTVGKETIKDCHLAHLPYLQACVKESLRLHPPGPLLLPHQALETCEVLGYKIPKDSLVFVNMWAIGRDAATWKDPLSFKPERFLDNGLDFKGMDFEFIPFGAGRRMCPGQHSAARHIPLILASLVHSFDWVLPNQMDASELDMTERFSVTMRKKQPLLLIPKVRN